MAKKKQGGGGNPYQQKITDAYIGTLFFDVRSLTTTWPDCTNRDVDLLHVNKLMSVFEAGVERVEEAKRLKVTVTKSEWDELLAYLMQVMNNGIIQAPAPLPVDVSVLELVATDKSRIISHLDSQALICPRDLPITPILEAGQHRKAALEKLLMRRTNFAESAAGQVKDAQSATEEDFRWSADVYIREHLDREALFALRANREEVSKADSNGDLLIRILTILRSKTLPEQAQLLKASKTKVWLTQAFGCGDDQFIGRLLQVIRARPPLQNAIRDYCATRYGAVHFRLTWASNVVLAALDFVSKDQLIFFKSSILTTLKIWVEKIEEFVANSKKVFRNKMPEVRAQDFQTLMALLPVKDISALQLLFFPSETDISNGLLVKELALPDSVATNTLPSLESFTTDDKTFVTRRPDFLPTMSDAEYCATYTFIAENQNIALPTWKEFSQLDSNVSFVVTGVLKHILTWYDATWEFPQKADDRRKTFDWVVELKVVVLERSELAGDGTRGYKDGADLLKIAKGIIREIWNQVESNVMWREKSAIAEAKQKPEILIGEKAKPTIADTYCTRFSYAHWANILHLVRMHSGPALNGHMATYNTMDLSNINQSTSSFGRIATSAIFKESQEVTHSRFLNSKPAKDTFVSFMNTAAYMACYQQLKRVMIATLEQGYAKAAPEKQRRGTGLILDDDEWLEVLSHVKRYASMLEDTGNPVDVDNMNEGIDGLPDKPGLLTQKPGSVTASNNSNLKRKEEAESTVEPVKRTSKRVKKSEGKL